MSKPPIPNPLPEHPVLPQCGGRSCTMCGNQAHHKVGEEFLDGQGALEGLSVPDDYADSLESDAWLAEIPARHNLTSYLCCPCFRRVMGGTGTPWCEPKAAPSAKPTGWQPIETAPTDGTTFLCWHGGHVHLAYWGGGLLWSGTFAWSDRPTHWMPLPEGPKP